MKTVPKQTAIDLMQFKARHKTTGEMCDVLLICFVNRYVDVLPDSELEGGNQVEWKFDEIDLFVKL